MIGTIGATKGIAVALAACTFAATAGCASNATRPAAALDAAASLGNSAQTAARTTQLTALVDQLVADGAPGVIVRVDDGSGHVIQIADQAPWTKADDVLKPNAEFRMGSNTKTMTATLVLQLVAEKRISLDDSVAKWLPGMIPNGNAITIRMLLNHTSGLFNDIEDPAVLKAFTGQDASAWSPQQLIEAAVAHPPLFAPGSQYSYSNTNYVALGLILEKATGKDLATLIHDRIAVPLGLTDTYLAPATSSAADRSNSKLTAGYEPDAQILAGELPPYAPAGTAFAGPSEGDWTNTTWVNESTEWAAGGMVSTAADWAKFQEALVTGKLIPPAQLREMETTVSEGQGVANRYGLGFEQTATPCGTVWGHDGQAPGYSSWNYTDPTGHRTVAVFVTTIFGLAQPKTAAASQNLIDAATCAMLDKSAS
jgi:D-alanyl-D-alanine carboxypeptidase